MKGISKHPYFSSLSFNILFASIHAFESQYISLKVFIKSNPFIFFQVDCCLMKCWGTSLFGIFVYSYLSRGIIFLAWSGPLLEMMMRAPLSVTLYICYNIVLAIHNTTSQIFQVVKNINFMTIFLEKRSKIWHGSHDKPLLA